MKKLCLLIAVLAIASVALYGCGKKTSSTTNTGASDTPPAPPTSDTIPTDATK
jgi:hypothetical protein